MGCAGAGLIRAVSTMTMPDETNEKLSCAPSSLPTCRWFPKPSTCAVSVAGGSTMICASMTVWEPVFGGMQRKTKSWFVTGSLNSSRVSK